MNVRSRFGLCVSAVAMLSGCSDGGDTVGATDPSPDASVSPTDGVDASSGEQRDAGTNPTPQDDSGASTGGAGPEPTTRPDASTGPGPAPPDASIAEPDAGGSPEPDASAPDDAGGVHIDSGVVHVDAGNADTDAAVVDSDAGFPGIATELVDACELYCATTEVTCTESVCRQSCLQTFDTPFDECDRRAAENVECWRTEYPEPVLCADGVPAPLPDPTYCDEGNIIGCVAALTPNPELEELCALSCARQDEACDIDVERCARQCFVGFQEVAYRCGISEIRFFLQCQTAMPLDNWECADGTAIDRGTCWVTVLPGFCPRD